MTTRRSGWIFVSLACLSLGCSEPRPKNVLLISIDTLRADRLGCYGFHGRTSPHIDTLARDGVRFENVLSPVPLTLPAHTSLLTGTIPPVHGIHDNLSAGLGSGLTTLAELFQGAGFRTGAIVSSFVLDSRFHLSRGFETYNDDFEEEHRIAFLSERKGDETTRLAKTWLESRGDERFFLFLHYYDPHDDYSPPPPFASAFSSDPYSGEVAFVDQQVGEVLSKLEELDLLQETLIVLTSDHGEMLEEHGEATHGYFIYESALRVPLIFRGASIEPGLVEERVGLVDVAPTIAALVGLEFPAPIQGKDLSDLVRGDAKTGGRRELYLESVTPNRYYRVSSLFGLVTNEWKFIHTARPELYDLRRDPGERVNVIEDHPDIATGMKSRLAEILDAEAPSESRPGLDEEALRRLASLGYLAGTGGTNPDDELLKDDPKDWIAFYRNHQRLEKLVAGGNHREARELAEAMTREKPDFVAGHLQLGVIAIETGELDQARAHFSRAITLDPDNKAAHTHLAEVLARLGDTEGAKEQYRKVLALDPGSTDASGRLARLLADDGNFESALATLRKTVAAHPENPDARVQLSIVLASAGSWDEAASELRKALEIDPRHPEAHLQIANLLLREGKLDESVAHYRRALQSSPRAAEAHHRLGLALREGGHREEALEHLRQAVTIDPLLAQAHNHLGLTLKEMGRLDEARASYLRALEVDPGLSEAHNNLGSLLASQGQVKEAIEHFRLALEANPDHEEAENNLGLALRMIGAREEALRHFRAALRKRPDWPEPMSEVAWILATHPEEAARNPKEALRLATRAAELTGRREPVILDTLAAALAANGEFERAAGVGEEALNLAASQAPLLAPEIRSRVALYREGKPFREASRTVSGPRSH